MKKLVLIFLGLLIVSCGSGPKPKFHDNIVVAHRGAWKANSLPENSIASLKQAVAIGAHGSEFDVHISADDSIVVNHDDDFKGMLIEDTRYNELISKKLSNGEKLPTLREYLEEGMKQKTTKLILEIKKTTDQERTLELTRRCVALVKKMKAEKWVDYITFDYEAGKLVHELDPNAEIAYLSGDVSPAQAKKDGYTGLDYHFSKYRENPEWIPEAHALGMSINAWTVNSEEDMKYMMGQNAEYITTNEPELLLQLLTDEK
ncbi:glycerophosphodiester phosphodiesterase family protein [Gramella sp. AN32]|uniref:Glycerophosphodiester phosphodiesterase n=1 Tax=Christiangramia antarctica TaxID=2058158 RepID=A0ABW5WZS9_9FLAO|nr:glycerophosphodiester phosphodiesterase family protein [Gramella sp. AN32]MCM4155705.1 glycerophosphodiester phosphodiesterase [Gramella sp. AN32]